MDKVSLNRKPLYDEVDEFEIEGDCAMTEYVSQASVIKGENLLHPAVGLEFESYEDVYYFYNCYAKDQGFGVRVSNTWYRKSRERYRGKLSCSSAGFKKISVANRPRPETRTGCPAMIKFRLMDNKRWRIVEVELEHNHLISPASGKFYKSHKSMGLVNKRPLHFDGIEETKKIRLFQTIIIDKDDNGALDVDDGEYGNGILQSNQLRFKQGDAQAIYNFCCHMQILNSNFFYVVDLNEKGCLRNVFWADARSGAAYHYFRDIMAIETTCLEDKYEVPLVLFSGVNHHGQSVPFGWGLVAGETAESFTWLFRAWLTYMVGHPPQAIITGLCKCLQTAISDVFPRASHCLSLSCIMKKVPDKLGGLQDYESIKKAFTEAAYHSTKAEDFDLAWQDMMRLYDIGDCKFLQTLYHDRKKWVPSCVKDIFLAGMFPIKPSESSTSLFEGYLHEHTSLNEFLDNYDHMLQKIYQNEVLADLESRNSSPILKSSFYFELQLSRLYTNNIFMNFQREVEGMFSCFSTTQTNVNGSAATYIVKEHTEVDEGERETQDYEVIYNASEAEVLCVCGLFNLKGYLCRHALSVLNQNGIEEIPSQYIFPRWRKDSPRSYVLDRVCNGIDIRNPIHRYDHLYKRAVQVMEEGSKSHNRSKFLLQELDQILHRVRL